MKTASRITQKSGMALVITLILLSVITFMAVTFLVLSQRQRGSVVTATDQIHAKESAEFGVRRALAESMAIIKGASNANILDIKVSTNYVNLGGFMNSGPLYTNPANVGFWYANNGLPLTGNDSLQNLSNLLYSPRVPVFVKVSAISNDFRYYLDLNRNGRYDTNGWLVELNDRLQWVTNPVTGWPQTNFYVGDPEWVGILEKPEYRHSRTNLFIGRYAYIVVPASKTLDQNFIHNFVKAAGSVFSTPSMAGNDRFSRNQGVGPWEINLAAFLVDLNTNIWPYPEPNTNGMPYRYFPVYNPLTDMMTPNTGVAFDDAIALLRHRYAANTSFLQPASALSVNAARAFTTNNIDDYGCGPLMTTNMAWTVDPDTVNSRWAHSYPGSENPYRFFYPQDYFDRNKTARLLPATVASFSDRLRMAGTLSNYYNRYTFYRMLAQLGTDSAVESSGKLNVNYANMDTRGNVILNLATNFNDWQPTNFFVNAANRMLAKSGYTFTVTNIQIWPTNYYTPSVHRLLQLAANIFDSTTNRPLSAYPYFPSVFRPHFGRYPNDTNIYIIGYTELTNATILGVALPSGQPSTLMRDLQDPRQRANIGLNFNDMVWGFPLVVGAKKGFPNFNEFGMETKIQLTRKLEFERQPLGSTTIVTNQMLLFSISNVFGMEAWNSYAASYPRRLQMFATVTNSICVSNVLNGTTNYLVNCGVFRGNVTDVPLNSWPGYLASGAFKLPYDPINNGTNLVEAAYVSAARGLTNVRAASFEQGFPVTPDWLLYLRTRALFALVDMEASPNRIVDYVNLDSIETPMNISEMLRTNRDCDTPPITGTYVPNGQAGSLWCINRDGPAPLTPTHGVRNQIGICLGNIQPDLNADQWNDPRTGTAVVGVPGASITTDAINFFRGQILNTTDAASRSNRFFAPYQPTRRIYFLTSWQANDPLVHYTIGDLTDPTQRTNQIQFDTTGNQSRMDNLRRINTRYSPWGPPPGQSGSQNDPYQYNLMVKDPKVTKSDDWAFPTNKYPNIGWLGRVHRGTPWQTVYLKAGAVTNAQWIQYSGNYLRVTNWGQIDTNLVPSVPNLLKTMSLSNAILNATTFDAFFSHPTNDYYLVDMFTTAINDNIARGQMSINQTNLAAWSAVLSGVDLLSRTNRDAIVQPAGTYLPTAPPQLVQLVNGINNYRASTNNVGGVFHRLGDILRVPELTVNSPYIINPPLLPLANTNFASDAVYERIPQQILGLLKGGEQPRFVIYSYGQALKPANASIVTAAGPYRGMCTNYQITAEVATRTVVRIEGAPNNPKAVVESYTVLPPD